KPSYPEQAKLQLAGCLDERTFYNLKSKKLIGNQFDYYSDFRWGTKIIGQMHQQILDSKIKEDSDAKKLLALLDIAEKNETGLIAYAD
ncbi:MAG: hypothetical protein HYZ42_06855, partial [Bacteroidetes bacterium]|nr:hypothetical protein [Bacteroidota bacterium]